MDTIDPGVQRSIPHRPPFLFIDRVVSVSEDRAVAERTLRADEPHFAGHYPGYPIMPGVLLCESCFQAGAILLAHRLEKPQKPGNGEVPLLARILEAKFKRPAYPGDTLEIEARVAEQTGSFFFMSGTVRREGKVVASVRYALTMGRMEG